MKKNKLKAIKIIKKIVPFISGILFALWIGNSINMLKIYVPGISSFTLKDFMIVYFVLYGLPAIIFLIIYFVLKHIIKKNEK